MRLIFLRLISVIAIPSSLFIGIYSYGFMVSWLSELIGFFAYLVAFILIPFIGIVAVFLPLIDPTVSGNSQPTLVFQIWIAWISSIGIFAITYFSARNN